MHQTTSTHSSIGGLIRNLTDDTKRLVRQEIDLVKSEVSEKISHFGRHAVALAIGGVLAYAGFIVLLMGLGWLAAWGLQQAGVQAVLAGFIGLAAVGLLIAIVGVGFLLKGMKGCKTEPLAPQKTIYTIQRLKNGEAPARTAAKPAPAPKHSSSEMQSRVVATEDRMTDAIGELGLRLSPRHISAQMSAQMKNRIHQKPYHAGMAAIVTGVVGGLLLGRPGRRS
jgi:Putative Actinobacterial Holin-X, holin superfamily III